jgi:hypothetical protein
MRITCTLPYASDDINGVKFAESEGGVKVSDEISDETAAQFLSIPGYAVVGDAVVGDEPARKRNKAD